MLNTWETQEMWYGSQLDAGGGVQALMRAGESSRSRINAHLTDGQHLARGFAVIRCTQNQFKSTAQSNVYLTYFWSLEQPLHLNPPPH